MKCRREGTAIFEELDYLYGKLQSIRPLSPESVRQLSEDFMMDYTSSEWAFTVV